MTNHEYERASVEAAVGLRKLAAVDARITETESALVYLLHQRREIVNQYDLNKCKSFSDHAWTAGSNGKCIRCGKTLREAEESYFGVKL